MVSLGPTVVLLHCPSVNLNPFNMASKYGVIIKHFLRIHNDLDYIVTTYISRLPNLPSQNLES